MRKLFFEVQKMLPILRFRHFHYIHPPQYVFCSSLAPAKTNAIRKAPKQKKAPSNKSWSLTSLQCRAVGGL